MLRRAFVALLLAVPLVSTGGTAQAAGCTQVTVVVQYLNGGQDVRCTDGDPSSGLDALTKAGFGYTFHPRNPGFVCRVKNLPAAGQDCMKPKYWSYWHAPSPNGPWTYSSEGAGTYDPAPGSVEGWRFDCGGAPGGASKCAASSPKPKPTPKPAPTPKPKPTQKSTPAPTHTPSSRPSAGSSAKAGSGTSPSAAAKATKAATKAKAKAAKAKQTKKAKQAAATAASASVTPSPDNEIANASASQSAPPAASEPARRGTLPWWLGVVALVLIGGTAGAVTVVRRR